MMNDYSIIDIITEDNVVFDAITFIREGAEDKLDESLKGVVEYHIDMALGRGECE